MEYFSHIFCAARRRRQSCVPSGAVHERASRRHPPREWILLWTKWWTVRGTFRRMAFSRPRRWVRVNRSRDRVRHRSPIKLHRKSVVLGPHRRLLHRASPRAAPFTTETRFRWRKNALHVNDRSHRPCRRSPRWPQPTRPPMAIWNGNPRWFQILPAPVLEA